MLTQLRIEPTENHCARTSPRDGTRAGRSCAGGTRPHGRVRLIESAPPRWSVHLLLPHTHTPRTSPPPRRHFFFLPPPKRPPPFFSFFSCSGLGQGWGQVEVGAGGARLGSGTFFSSSFFPFLPPFFSSFFSSAGLPLLAATTCFDEARAAAAGAGLAAFSRALASWRWRWW